MEKKNLNKTKIAFIIMIILLGVLIDLLVLSPVSITLAKPENLNNISILTNEELHQALEEALSNSETVLLIQYLVDQQNFTLHSENAVGIKNGKDFWIKIHFTDRNGHSSCKEGALIRYSRIGNTTRAAAIWAKNGQGYTLVAGGVVTLSNCYYCICAYEADCCIICGSWPLYPCEQWCPCFYLDCLDPWKLICINNCIAGECAACQGCPC